MFTVYLIHSLSDQKKRYVGYTADFEKRLKEHNSGLVPFTKNNGPWRPAVLVQFDDVKRAKDFEKYLKHGSGHAFAKKHFW